MASLQELAFEMHTHPADAIGASRRYPQVRRQLACFSLQQLLTSSSAYL